MPKSTPNTYVVEHMEPELGPWSTLEYITCANESATANPPCRFFLSSMPESLVKTLPESITSLRSESFVTTSQSIEDVEGVTKARVCLLDPQADEELKPEDNKLFDYFVFGGILGDDPPRDRTAELRKYGYAGRNLRKIQMTTDTAVRVTRLVIDGQKKLDEIRYVDYPDIQISKNESTEMPFRYVDDGRGDPVMPAGMLDLIKKDADKSFDDLF